MFAIQAGAAVAAGNTVVVKTSARAPLVVSCRVRGRVGMGGRRRQNLYVAALVKEAGFPPGAIGVLNGHGPTTGAALAAHRVLRKLAFTGSTAAGRLLMEVSAETNMEKVQLVLKGKSPCLVFEDDVLEDAAGATAFSMAFIGGQSRFSNTRILVQEGDLDRFLSLFVPAFSQQGANGEEPKIPMDVTRRPRAQRDCRRSSTIFSSTG